MLSKISTTAGVVAFIILATALWPLFLVLGALVGWFAVWILSFVFTFDYDLARTIGLVTGAISFPILASNVKD